MMTGLITSMGYVIKVHREFIRKLEGLALLQGPTKVTLKSSVILGVEVSSHALETFFTIIRE